MKGGERLRRAVGAATVVTALAVARPAAAAADPFATWLGLPAWIWMLANLVLFFGVLGYYLGPPIARFLDRRGQRITAELEEARERRAEAAALQATLGEKLARLEEQVREILARGESEGQREHGALLAQAERERDRLLAQVRGEIDHRLTQARQELKRHTAALAAGLAREQLERELGPEERERIFRRNLSRLEQREPS
ncbi:MAG TPA: ATP synthase F0 subunit B [Thermoanaerobaculia bacterium]|nr:ATP synthase F0 subunit B [Thermoanaerobaculia bacterium]